MKILHSADWHLDAPFAGRPQAAWLRRELLKIPGKVAAVCREENCDMMVLSGDLFDGPYTRESLDALITALKEVRVPVFISPGNHDHLHSGAPWDAVQWPGNVHIFKNTVPEGVLVEQLDSCIWGAGFDAVEAPALLQNFHACGAAKWQVGVFHGDPTQVNSPYNPITAGQIRASGLDYLALGHIHKGGHIDTEKTICAWPGCPMGRGFDELGEKGVLVVTLDETKTVKFVPLDTVRFHDLEVAAGEDPAQSLAALLPGAGSDDLYRITFTGESTGVDTEELTRRFSQFPNLELRDRTVPPVDIWAAAGSDSLEGVYFGMLKSQLETADEETAARLLLAAQISRKILDGQEVVLP